MFFLGADWAPPPPYLVYRGETWLGKADWGAGWGGSVLACGSCLFLPLSCSACHLSVCKELWGFCRGAEMPSLPCRESWGVMGKKEYTSSEKDTTNQGESARGPGMAEGPGGGTSPWAANGMQDLHNQTPVIHCQFLSPPQEAEVPLLS